METDNFKTVLYLLIIIAINQLGTASYCQADTLHADEFSSCFGGTTVKNNTQGDIGVIMERTQSGEDAGCEFHPKGGNIPLDNKHSRIELKPERSINDGYYVVTITFKNEDGKWAETDWIKDNGQRSTEVHILPDVRKLANDNKIKGMTEYFIKIRVQPWKFEGLEKPAFVFSQLLILPVK